MENYHNSMDLRVKVVVGIVQNEKGQFLVSRRPEHSFYSAGYWEFPGGKVEPSESQWDALIRELKEEVNLDIISASPFLFFEDRGSERLIELDVWRIDEFKGEAAGLEGQAIQWLRLEELRHIVMLPANQQVLARLEEDKDKDKDK